DGPSGGSLLPVGTHQMAHAVGLLRALGHPVVDAGQIQLQLRLAAPGDRIEEPDVLEAQAPLALTAVRDHHVIEGLVARAAPRQANRYHGRLALVTPGNGRGA